MGKLLTSNAAVFSILPILAVENSGKSGIIKETAERKIVGGGTANGSEYHKEL